jgi:hypothetical protein
VKAYERYDRQLLLLGAKRNAVLELWEVQRYGSDSYGDVDYVSIHGLPPSEWYARGIGLLGPLDDAASRGLDYLHVLLGGTHQIVGYHIGRDGNLKQITSVAVPAGAAGLAAR